MQCHLELAKCDLQMDFVSKANLQVKKAVALDHGFLSVEEEEEEARAAETKAGGTSGDGGKGKPAAAKGKKGKPVSHPKICLFSLTFYD